MIRTSSSAKSPLGSDSETPPALASIGCSQPTRHEPKWAALTPAQPKSHNHCAELLEGKFNLKFLTEFAAVGLGTSKSAALGYGRLPGSCSSSLTCCGVS